MIQKKLIEVRRDVFDKAAVDGTHHHAVINLCRREGYVYNGLFIYESSGKYFLAKEVDYIINLANPTDTVLRTSLEEV